MRLSSLLAAAICLFACSDHSDHHSTSSAPLEFPDGAIVPAVEIGRLPGSLEVSATGSATYRIPIDVPAGRNGMQPELALANDSRGDNGPLGVGWSVSGLSKITRCPPSLAFGGGTGGVVFNPFPVALALDQFCLDGKPLVAVEGDYGADGTEYRTMPDTQARIVSYGAIGGAPSSFKVYDRDGRIAFFTERLGSGRVYSHELDGTLSVTASHAVYGWALTLLQDRSGNSMTVAWGRETDPSDAMAFEHFPLAIYYSYPTSGVPTGTPNREVRFDYEARPDTIDAYISGFHFRTTRRLRSISTFAPYPDATGTLVHRYNLEYETGVATKRSLLRRVTECDANGACLPATEFGWDRGGYAHDEPIEVKNVWGFRIADANGDGKDDIFDNNGCVRLATGTAFEAPRCIDSYKWTDRITALIDHNRDSTADVLVHGLSEDTLGRGYDAFGRIGSVHYPSTPLGGVDITYAYAGDGSLDRVLRGGATLWEAKDFDASGRGTLEQLGNGAFVSRAYDAATGRLRDIESYLMVAGDVFPEKVAFQHLSYTQYADGQPSSRVDHITGLTETFTYDDADRLVAWSQTGASGTGSFGLTYDALGNMTSSICPDGAHAYGHGVGAGPHAVTSIDGTVISYDGAGRRTSDPAGTITYTPFDLPREITSAAGTTSFGYDAFGARVTKQSPADTTVYVGGIYERRTGGEESHHFYVRAANRVVAEIVESGGTQDIRYLHPDHLGSTQVLTDGAGAVLERRWYTPFGQLTTAMPTGGDRHTGGFTGHESDFAERLVNMRGRIYDPATRRFLTPDPIIGRPQLGQNFNRYAYVLNAPLTYVDPTGLDGGSPDDSCGQCDFDDEEGTYINVEQEEQEQQEEREGAPDYEPDGADFEPDYDVDYDPGSGYQDSDDYGYDDAYGNSRDGQPAPVPTGGQTRQSSETTLFEAATEFLSGIGDWVGDHVSYGTTVQATVVAPILSGGGGHLGLNAQVVPGEGKSGLFAVTTPNENFPVGVGAGVSIGANVAIGEGAWSGAFREIDAGPVALFWSPGEGGWVGGPQ